MQNNILTDYRQKLLKHRAQVRQERAGAALLILVSLIVLILNLIK